MLASMPKSNIRQRLMRTKEGKSWGAWPARSWRSWSLPDALLGPDQTGRVQMVIAEGEYRMETFDQALVKLVEANRVTYEEALQVTSPLQDYHLRAQSLGLGMPP